jgi:uncharacterized membrane protein (UPF0127 family)
VLGGLATGCSRTPSEPSAAAITPDNANHLASTSVVAATATIAPSAVPIGQCVLPTPSEPPPPALPAPRCPPDPTGPPMLATATLEIDNGAKVTAEIARTEEETSRGLMYRTKMAEDRGMIFAMERMEHTFWMKNTCLPLDMLFIDLDGTIVGIAENVPVLNEKSRTVGCPSTHVLEVNAGWCRRHGVRAGQKVKLPLP